MQSPQLQVKAAFLMETYRTNFNTPNGNSLCHHLLNAIQLIIY